MDKRTMILDCNDILFSTQYMYLLNIERSANADETGELTSQFRIILANILKDDHSLFQSIIRRDIEDIVDVEELFEIMKFAEFKEALEEGIQLHSPFSKYMMNLHKMTLEANIICTFRNELEEFMLNARLEELEKGLVRTYNREALIEFITSDKFVRDEYALFTSDSKLIEHIKDKIDIMIPDTLPYLKQYHSDSNVYPIKGLWSHIK